jgi:SSS family solute:Na+ symporter
MMFLAVVYLTAQLVTIRNTFNSLFDIDPEALVAVVIIASSIVAFEWMGGLSSVALTDYIQGFIMILCFIALPSLVVRHYGGWKGLDWETYPHPKFYQTPSSREQWLFWNFIVSLGGGFLQPHLMHIQRVYAAESFRGLKVAYSVLTLGPWFTMLSRIFLGTVGVQLLAHQGANIDEVSSPFASILETIMDVGGVSCVIGSIAFTATLASIMSTTDSVLIAISQLITTKVVLPIFPSITVGRQLVGVGRAASFLAMFIGLLLTFFRGQSLSELILIQYGITLQGIPLVWLGIFSSGCI